MCAPTYHIALMHLWVHSQLHYEPRSIAQDESRNQIPVNDVPQAADAPAYTHTKNSLNTLNLINS